MILSLKKKYNYNGRTKGYKVVVVHVDPRYDIRAPDNNFIKNRDYLEIVELCEKNNFKSLGFKVVKSTIYVMVPSKDSYHNNWQLADIFIRNIHEAALEILIKNGLSVFDKGSEMSIDIFMHEHAVCIEQKCLWRQFVDLLDSKHLLNSNYRIQIVQSPTIFVNGCEEFDDEIEFYKSSNKDFYIDFCG